MQLDRALILSAGMGTRMGEIGKILPKVLWPIFSKSLLELQIQYCRNLGIKNIYINVHYLADDIKHHMEQIPDKDHEVILLFENPLLDSGGAIHNLARQEEVNYKGNVLLVNGDQFLFFDNNYFTQALEYLIQKNMRATLFGITVNKNENYNETVIVDGRLREIKKNLKTHDYITYSGLGIIKLDDLHPTPGISKFFESVVNFKQEEIYMITPSLFEYWDFGTAEIYAKNIFRIADENLRSSMMHDFLTKANIDFINSSNFINTKINSIDLDRRGKFAPSTIFAKNISQSI